MDGSRVIGALVLGSCAVLLTQCGSIRVNERNIPVRGMERPGVEAGELYGEVYRLIIRARRLEGRQPEVAVGLYLDAAQRAWRSRDERMLPLYNHACGQVVDLMVERRWVAGRFSGGGGEFVVSQAGTEVSAFALGGMDDVLPANCLKFRAWRTGVRRSGVGAPVVVRASGGGRPSGVRDAPKGLSYPATVVIDFPGRGSAAKSAGGRAVVRVFDPNKRDAVVFWGRSRKISYDMTAPLAVALNRTLSVRKEAVLKWRGVFRPTRFADRMGLYMSAPFDPGKIPVVLVHGLKSDPAAWRNVVNELSADRELRRRYQFLVYYYPTGLPLRVPAADLKRRINALHGYQAKRGGRGQGARMVIVGHSLGGILTSFQVRRIGRDLMHRVFRGGEGESLVNPEVLRDLRYLANGPEPRFVTRVVFIATPHRGSEDADWYVTRVLSTLVDIPKKMLVLKVPEAAGSLTDFGRMLLGVERPENSLSLLRTQSAALRLLDESPIYEHVRYHSIMGDRGLGGTPDSSDGVVVYQSAHLDGAESEKIVPSGHDAQDHPEAVRELRRILKEHLRKN